MTIQPPNDDQMRYEDAYGNQISKEEYDFRLFCASACLGGAIFCGLLLVSCLACAIGGLLGGQ